MNRSYALTGAQQKIAPLLAQGLSDKAIASALGLSYGTIKKQLAFMFARLGVSNRTQAAVLLAERMK